MISVSIVDKVHREPVKLSRAAKRQKVEEDITLFEEDTTGVQYPHTDAVVITMNMDDCNVHHVLIDSGSIVDVLYFQIFFWMKLSVDRLANYKSHIQDFSCEPMPMEEVITLLTKAGTSLSELSSRWTSWWSES